MKSGKYLVWRLLLIAVLLLAACGGQGAQPEPAAEESDAGSIAVILTGPWDDNSWNEAGHIAVHALEDKGAKIAFSENVADADVGRVLREYADQGFEMIVAHSFSYQDPTFEVAEEFPDINFAWAGGIGRMAKNVADYDQPFYEAAFPIGVLAGHMSQSGVLGALYGFDIPVCHAMGEALLAGAKTVNPDASLIQTAVGEIGAVPVGSEPVVGRLVDAVRRRRLRLRREG